MNYTECGTPCSSPPFTLGCIRYLNYSRFPTHYSRHAAATPRSDLSSPAEPSSGTPKEDQCDSSKHLCQGMEGPNNPKPWRPECGSYSGGGYIPTGIYGLYPRRFQAQAPCGRRENHRNHRLHEAKVATLVADGKTTAEAKNWTAEQRVGPKPSSCACRWL